MNRLPSWMRTTLGTNTAYREVHNLLTSAALHTVCQSARCPNIRDCWNRRTATFMILGDRCTRHCRFCAVEKGPCAAPSHDEPDRVAQAARQMRLAHVVITSVTRDDLPDGGAGVFAEVIARVRQCVPGITVEVLVPDFLGNEAAVKQVCNAGPDVFGHNLETVRRLQSMVRPEASYERSLHVLRIAAKHGLLVKSGLILGLGESESEADEALRDLREAGCCMVTLGQYLAPSRAHMPVSRFLSPNEFETWARRARELGFAAVASGPLVRSSYRAQELLIEARERERLACRGF